MGEKFIPSAVEGSPSRPTEMKNPELLFGVLFLQKMMGENPEASEALLGSRTKVVD
jgi:hypothetical protein